MLIRKSAPEDLDAIFQLFDAAIAYQKTKFEKHWLGFDRALISTEIQEGRHWKIMCDGQLAAFFSLTYEDSLIWGASSKEPAIYLHRIVTNPHFRGRRFINQIITWGQVHARRQGKNYIRMDTWADNRNLINYYVDVGFKELGVRLLSETTGLPSHYAGNSLTLFQIELSTMYFPMGKPPTALEKLAAYNCWANEVLVQWLEAIGEHVPDTSLHLLSHISNAQLIWLSRIENAKEAFGVFDAHTLAQCRVLLEESSDQLLELAAMPAEGLRKVIRYLNTKGEAFETGVEDILLHVFNHGTYHRAQIARDLRQNGLTPVNTDYITYVRNLSVPS